MNKIYITLTLLFLLSASSLSVNAQKQQQFVHNVYFWTPKENSAKHTKELLKGLEMLKKIKVVKGFRLGIPAGTDREVVDNSYQIHLMVAFDSKEDQDIYQKAPIHLKFIDLYKHTWKKVQIYDSVLP